MSLINTNGINENFPVQGEDNPSSGFRTNFSAIKTALNQAKNELDDLQSNTAQGVRTTEDNLIYNDFQGNVIEDAIIDKVSYTYFPGQTNLSGTQVNIDLNLGLTQKIGIIGDTTIKFNNWPTATTEPRYHKFILHVFFNINPTDPNRFDYRLKFSTALGGIIKSCSPLEYEVDPLTNKYFWFLRPSVVAGVSTNTTQYEHVIEVWSYDNREAVFINYVNKFIGE